MVYTHMTTQTHTHIHTYTHIYIYSDVMTQQSMNHQYTVDLTSTHNVNVIRKLLISIYI